jgi:hypothetical protein
VSYHFEPIATKAAARYVFDASWGERRARAFYRSTYGWLLRQHLDADLRFVEKTPQNSFVVPFLARAFPEAQFVHIIRDGRDVALSYSKEPWLQAASLGSDRWEPGGYRWGPYARFWVERERVDEFESTSDLHRCIWAWRRFTEAALAAGADLSSARYLELRYEDVVTEPGAAAEPLLEFLGEYGQDAQTALQRALSGARPASVGRWRNELTTEMRRPWSARPALLKPGIRVVNPYRRSVADSSSVLATERCSCRPCSPHTLAWSVPRVCTSSNASAARGVGIVAPPLRARGPGPVPRGLGRPISRRQRSVRAAPYVRIRDGTDRVAGSVTPPGERRRHLRHLSGSSATPDAVFVHIVRAGRDVVASLYDVAKSNPEEWGGFRDLDSCINRWLEDVEITRSRMGHPRHMPVRYERLVNDPERELRTVCESIGLPFERKMVDNTVRPSRRRRPSGFGDGTARPVTGSNQNLRQCSTASAEHVEHRLRVDIDTRLDPRDSGNAGLHLFVRQSP